MPDTGDLRAHVPRKGLCCSTEFSVVAGHGIATRCGWVAHDALEAHCRGLGTQCELRAARGLHRWLLQGVSAEAGRFPPRRGGFPIVSWRPLSPLATRLEHAFKAACVGCHGLSGAGRVWRRGFLGGLHTCDISVLCCRPLWRGRHGRRCEDQRPQLRVVVSVRGEEDEVLLELLLVVHALLEAA